MYTRGDIFFKSHEIWAYTDHIIIPGRRIEDVQEVFNSLVNSAQKLRVMINESKTKFLTLSRKTRSLELYIKIGEYTSEIVEQFAYLGRLLNPSNGIRREVERRINNANVPYFALLTLLKTQIFPRYVKIRTYKS